MSERSDEQKTKIEKEKAKKFRSTLRKQGAYMADNISSSASDFFSKHAFGKNEKFVLLNPSSANPEPRTAIRQSDNLAWEGTHMIFSVTTIDSSRKEGPINKTRFIIGDDGITELIPFIDTKGFYKNTIGFSIDKDKSNRYNDLNVLLESYIKEGYAIVTVAKKEENLYTGVADFIEDKVSKNNYAVFSDFDKYKSSMEAGEEIKNKADSKAQAEDIAEPGKPFTPMAGMAGKPKQQAEPKGPPPSKGSRPHG